MLESEAKTKWCPMLQVTPSNGANTNRDHVVKKLEGDHKYNCLGSGCALWEGRTVLYLDGKQISQHQAANLVDGVRKKVEYLPAGSCGLITKGCEHE